MYNFDRLDQTNCLSYLILTHPFDNAGVGNYSKIQTAACYCWNLLLVMAVF